MGENYPGSCPGTPRSSRARPAGQQNDSFNQRLANYEERENQAARNYRQNISLTPSRQRPQKVTQEERERYANTTGLPALPARAIASPARARGGPSTDGKPCPSAVSPRKPADPSTSRRGSYATQVAQKPGSWSPQKISQRSADSSTSRRGSYATQVAQQPGSWSPQKICPRNVGADASSTDAEADAIEADADISVRLAEEIKALAESSHLPVDAQQAAQQAMQEAVEAAALAALNMQAHALEVGNAASSYDSRIAAYDAAIKAQEDWAYAALLANDQANNTRGRSRVSAPPTTQQRKSSVAKVCPGPSTSLRETSRRSSTKWQGLPSLTQAPIALQAPNYSTTDSAINASRRQSRIPVKSETPSRQYSSTAPASRDPSVDLERTKVKYCPASPDKRIAAEQKRLEVERLKSIVNVPADGTPKKVCQGTKRPTLDYSQYQKMLQSEAEDVTNLLNLSMQSTGPRTPVCAKKSESPAPDDTDQIPVPVAVAMAADMMLIGETGLTLDSNPTRVFNHLFPRFQEEAITSVGPPASSPKGPVVPMGEDHQLVRGMGMEDATLMATVVKMDAVVPTKSYFNDTIGSARLNKTDWDSRLATKGENSLEATLADISVGNDHFQDVRLTSLSIRHGLTPDGMQYVLNPEKPAHGSFFQLRGTMPPRWFPGYMSSVPAVQAEAVMLSEKPSEVMHNAWATLNPDNFHRDYSVVIGMA